jgi:hypothetical protein
MHAGCRLYPGNYVQHQTAFKADSAASDDRPESELGSCFIHITCMCMRSSMHNNSMTSRPSRPNNTSPVPPLDTGHCIVRWRRACLVHHHALVAAAVQVASLGLPAAAIVARDAPGLVVLAGVGVGPQVQDLNLHPLHS